MKEISTNRMTEGVIWKEILIFSIPLLIGNLFQQLYNAVDSVIVGNYVGSHALAAVGASNPIINLLVGFFMGISTGAGVVISQYFGARDEKGVHDSVHSTIALSLLGGIFLTIIGFIFTPTLLRLMGTPKDVFSGAALYLRIYFAGVIFILLYNMGSGILRAVGDSRRPLYYLIVASLLNIVLDLVFVIVFHMGIAGVAWATLIAQAISSILVVITMIRDKDIYKLILKDIRIHKEMIKRIFKVGIPSGLQQSIISISNLFVQSNINVFGAAAMAGCASYLKIDGFVILPMMSFAMAATIFTGQNIGARQFDRVKKGSRTVVAMSAGYTIIVSICLYLFGNKVIAIFNQEPDVLYYGNFMLKVLVPGYIFIAISQALAGIIRGSGVAFIPMIIMVSNMCVLRIIWLAITVPIYHNILVVFLGYPITWVTTAICSILYFWKGKWLYRCDMLQGL